jgi:D-sedoheptulose 7-phosphate isomerase
MTTANARAEFARGYFSKISRLLAAADLEAIACAMELVETAWRENRQIFVIGNGGSASTASHWACDLNKGTARADRPRLKVISLTDNMAHFSAIANDYGYDQVFIEQLRNLIQPHDLLIGISASGNSPNVVHAFDFARRSQAVTLAVVGFTGGKLREIADCVVHFPSDEYGPVEDLQLMLDHLITDWFRTVAMV